MSRFTINDLSFCETELAPNSQVCGGVTITNTINNSLGFGAVSLSVSVGVNIRPLNLPSLEGSGVTVAAAEAAGAAISDGLKNLRAIALVNI